MTLDRTLYLKVKPGDVAPYAILVGDPARVELFAEHIDGPTVVGRSREFTTVTGRYEGVGLSVVSTGIGAPAAAIVLEELALLGVRAVARAGTMMAVRARVGSLILAESALRFESTSLTYAPAEVPAVADADLFAAFREILEAGRHQYAAGLAGTADGFYTQMRSPRKGDPPPALIGQFYEGGVLGADMETSAVYVVAGTRGMRAVSCCAATVDGQTGQMLASAQREDLERTLVEVVLRSLQAFARKGRPASRDGSP